MIGTLDNMCRVRSSNSYPPLIHLTNKFLTRAFDLLKNERQYRTTQVVQSLICKTVSDTGQTGGNGQDKN